MRILQLNQYLPLMLKNTFSIDFKFLSPFRGQTLVGFNNYSAGCLVSLLSQVIYNIYHSTGMTKIFGEFIILLR